MSFVQKIKIKLSGQETLAGNNTCEYRAYCLLLLPVASHGLPKEYQYLKQWEISQERNTW